VHGSSLDAINIIRLYGLRFKIEHCFKQAIRLIGSCAYHFWMRGMEPLRYRNGNQYLHRRSDKYRAQVKRKVGAYHVFIQAGVVAQACYNISRSLLPSRYGTLSDPGCAPFARHSALRDGRCPGVALDRGGHRELQDPHAPGDVFWNLVRL